MIKSTPKKPVVPKTAHQTLGTLWGTVWEVFEDNLSYTTFCLISTFISVLITMVLLRNRFKRERTSAVTGKPGETVGDGDKEVKEGKEVEVEKEPSDKDAVESENPDSSEGQDGSEEDLPWILQKAPSQTTLSDDKENLTNDEKLSEDAESEKITDFSRVSKSPAGDLKGIVKKEVSGVEEM